MHCFSRFFAAKRKTERKQRERRYREKGSSDSMRLRKETEMTDGNMPEEEILLIANVSDALAHPARVKIFRYIMQSNKAMVTVCNKDLVEYFDYAQATISQHVKKLVTSGLVEVKKKDKFSYYYANLGMLSRYLNATRKFSVM